MFKNKFFLKSLAILSAVLGLILGLITIIPFICNFSFLTAMLFASPILFIYLKKTNMWGYIEPKEGAIYGAIVGFASFIGFSVSFVPLATILGFIFKGTYYSGISLMFSTSIVVTLMMIIFIAVLSALLNAFSGLVTMYIYNQIEPKPEEAQTSINIEE